MFGNRLVYTQSPGGIRRGLIWQSSDVVPGPTIDPRNYVWDFRVEPQPGNVPWVDMGTQGVFKKSTSFSDPYLTSVTPIFNDPNIVSGNNTYGAIFNSKILDILNPVPIEVPQSVFPYYTSFIEDPSTGDAYMASFGKATAYYADIEFQIRPEFLPILYSNASADQIARLIETPLFTDNPESTYSTQNAFELSSDCGPMNKGYGDVSLGQPIYTDQTSSSVQLMIARAQKRVMLSGVPLVFKGRVYFCELDFAAIANMIPAGIDPDNVTAFMLNEMAGYSVPGDSQFSGSKTRNNQSGNFFTDFHIGNLTKKNGYNMKHTYNTGALTRYQLSQGIISENNLFTLMFSPVVPPSCYLGSSNYDYIVRLGRGLTPPINVFEQVSIPEIAAPHLAGPVICGGLGTGTNNGEWWNSNSYYPSYIIPRYNYQGAVTGGSHFDPLICYGGNTFFNNVSNSPRGGSYSYNGYAYPYNASLSDHSDFNESNPPFTPFHPYLDHHFTSDLQRVQMSLDTIRYASMQPKIDLGEKILCEVEPVNSIMNVWYNSNSSGFAGQHSGKYKFCALKGKVSLFENLMSA